MQLPDTLVQHAFLSKVQVNLLAKDQKNIFDMCKFAYEITPIFMLIKDEKSF